MPKPRTPGLWMVDGNDEKQVMKAKEDLLRLLDDPYYFEAYQILFREKHPKLFGIKGKLPREIGALARQFQDGSDTPMTTKHKGRGRPPDPLLGYLRIDELSQRIHEIPGGSTKMKCRLFVRSCRGGLDDEETAKKAEWLYRKVRSSLRNAKQSTKQTTISSEDNEG